MSASSDATVVVRDAHVVYEVFEDRSEGLKRLFAAGRVRRRARRIHAVRGVSFEVYEGETLGVIGSNGSGKSSLLAAMTGLLPLDSGDIWVRSRPSLLGVAAALRPSLSGRRNILIGCLALGLLPRDIDERTDDIIDFAGLRDFIDLPMRTYSSGMRARLNFAIATAATPSILLIDEALAVGDADFQRRSQQRIDEIREAAGSVVLVSHNLAEIESSCDRVAWMEKGELRTVGPAADVVASYLSAQAVDEAVPATPRLDGVESYEAVPAEAALPTPVRGRRAVVHVGVVTAGDEELQAELRAHRGAVFKAGMIYPTFLGLAEHNRVASYGSADIAAHLGVCGVDDWDEWSRAFRQSFLRATAEGGDLVLTSTALALLEPTAVERVTGLLGEGGFETIDVLVVARRQDEAVAMSHYRQVARGGVREFDIDDVFANSERYDADDLIERWEAAPGVRDVHVRLHRDRDALPSAGQAFAALAGYPAPDPVDYQPDARVSPAQLAMLRELNKRVETALPVWLLARDSVSSVPSIPVDDATRLLDKFAASNARVLSRVPEPHRIDDYFSKPLASGVPESAFEREDALDFAARLSDHVALLNRRISRLGRET